MDRPAVGDWVAVRDGDHLAVIESILERSTCITRRDPGHGGAQVIASNVDEMWIVTSANRDFRPRRIERYLTVAASSGARPIVIINKSDLTEEISPLMAVADQVAAGVPVVAASAHAGDGIETLRGRLTGGTTAVLVGSSGVGKSTLINRMVAGSTQATGTVRGDDDKGRHTTTRRELMVVPGGGCIIDTPGMRELGLIDDEAGLAAAFADVEQAAQDCRFRDCRHDGEPGCAVDRAIADGELTEHRLLSYRKLERELAAEQRKRDPAQFSRAKARWKQTHMAMRARRKVDPKQRDS